MEERGVSEKEVMDLFLSENWDSVAVSNDDLDVFIVKKILMDLIGILFLTLKLKRWWPVTRRGNMNKDLTKKQKKIANRYDNMTGDDFEKEFKKAEKDGRVIKNNGSFSLSEAVKELDNRKKMVSMRMDPSVISGLKIKAKMAGIPYQTLAASVLKRYVEGELSIEKIWRLALIKKELNSLVFCRIELGNN